MATIARAEFPVTHYRTAKSDGLEMFYDRAGMLLCGDVPSAIAGAREVGELDRDLVEFTYSAAHVQLRSQLGLARG